MLIDGTSTSGGEALPWLFRKEGRGPLIGTRTWGSLIGLSGNATFLDGGDPSLEKGVEILLETLSKRPGARTKAPFPPPVAR